MSSSPTARAPFKRILFCTDFSENADFAFDFALEQARHSSDCTITLLHELTLRQQQDGVNGAALNLLNQVQQYGYATLEQAEGHRAGA